MQHPAECWECVEWLSVLSRSWQRGHLSRHYNILSVAYRNLTPALTLLTRWLVAQQSRHCWLLRKYYWPFFCPWGQTNLWWIEEEVIIEIGRNVNHGNIWNNNRCLTGADSSLITRTRLTCCRQQNWTAWHSCITFCLEPLSSQVNFIYITNIINHNLYRTLKQLGKANHSTCVWTAWPQVFCINWFGVKVVFDANSEAAFYNFSLDCASVVFVIKLIFK